MDPLQQPVPPVPQPPQAVPPVAAEGLSPDQMKSNLQGLMGKIDEKYQDFNSQKFSADNQMVEQRSDSLRQVFDLFESVGIDMNDPAAVKEFLDKLRQENPELSQQVEQALQELLGPDDQPVEAEETPEPGASPEGNMNINDEPAPENL